MTSSRQSPRMSALSLDAEFVRPLRVRGEIVTEFILAVVSSARRAEKNTKGTPPVAVPMKPRREILRKNGTVRVFSGNEVSPGNSVWSNFVSAPDYYQAEGRNPRKPSVFGDIIVAHRR